MPAHLSKSVCAGMCVLYYAGVCVFKVAGHPPKHTHTQTGGPDHIGRQLLTSVPVLYSADLLPSGPLSTRTGPNNKMKASGHRSQEREAWEDFFPNWQMCCTIRELQTAFKAGNNLEHLVCSFTLLTIWSSQLSFACPMSLVTVNVAARWLKTNRYELTLQLVSAAHRSTSWWVCQLVGV